MINTFLPIEKFLLIQKMLIYFFCSDVFTFFELESKFRHASNLTSTGNGISVFIYLFTYVFIYLFIYLLVYLSFI
jgi:hypothetical protein